MANQLEAAKAAKNLGISVNDLYTWISRAKSQGDFTLTMRSEHCVITGETADLMKRVMELEKANRILQDARLVKGISGTVPAGGLSFSKMALCSDCLLAFALIMLVMHACRARSDRNLGVAIANTSAQNGRKV